MSEPAAHKRLLAPYWATALGLLVAPIVGGALSLVIWATASDVLSGNLSGHSLANGFVGALMFGALYGAWIGLLPAFIIGWPLHVLLLRQRKTHLMVYVAAGAVLALVGFLVVMPLFGMGSLYLTTLIELGPAIALAGAIGAAVFWYIRRPDRGPDFYSEPAA